MQATRISDEEIATEGSDDPEHPGQWVPWQKVVVITLGAALVLPAVMVIKKMTGLAAGSSGVAVKPLVEIMPEVVQEKNEQSHCQGSELPNICTGWGDPHFDKRFHNLPRTDHYGVGVYPLAKSVNGDFELQGFQCVAGWSASSFTAFAVKIGGKSATCFGGDYTTFEWHPTRGPPDGVNVNGNPSDKDGLTMKSPNQCQSLWILKKPINGKHYLDMEVRMSSAANFGICGSGIVQKEVLPSKRLFNHSEMLHICNMCGVKNNCEGFHSGTTDVDAARICSHNHVAWADAVGKCNHALVHQDFVKSCVFDYCATGGDDAAVDNAIAESEHMSHSHD